jgi:hypothetical protein
LGSTSTTTTLPDPCATVAPAPTFESIECRLDALDIVVTALGSVTPRAPSLRDRLVKATDLAQQARASCLAGDHRLVKKSLKGSFRKLGRLRALLASKKTTGIPDRDELVATVNDLRSDVRALKGAVVCPDDAMGG